MRRMCLLLAAATAAASVSAGRASGQWTGSSYPGPRVELRAGIGFGGPPFRVRDLPIGRPVWISDREFVVRHPPIFIGGDDYPRVPYGRGVELNLDFRLGRYPPAWPGPGRGWGYGYEPPRGGAAYPPRTYEAYGQAGGYFGGAVPGGRAACPD